MKTVGQPRAARASFRVNQRRPAESAGPSLPTIRRLPASAGAERIAGNRGAPPLERPAL